MPTTIGNILVNQLLPEDLRRENFLLDKKGIEQLFTEIHKRYPDRYNELATKINKLGGYFAQASGHSLSLASTRKSPDVKMAIDKLKADINDIVNDDSIPEDKKDGLIIDMVSKSNPIITKMVMENGKKEDNPLAVQAVSGSRGNENQFRQIVAGDGLVADHRDNPISVPILSGYSEGLTPAEYFASSYGARRGSIATKFCFSGDTLVAMADGPAKPISEIRVDDIVLGANSIGGSYPVRVKAVSKSTDLTIKYSISNRSNTIFEVHCTPNHEVLAYNRRTKQVSKVPIHKVHVKRNQYYLIGAVRSSATSINFKDTKNFLALLVGTRCATGTTHNLGSAHCLSIAFRDKHTEFKDFLEYQCDAMGVAYESSPLLEGERIRRPDRIFAPGSVDGAAIVRVFDHPHINARKYMQVRGMLERNGYDHDFLPPDLETWSNDEFAAFMTGYLGVGGCSYIDPDDNRKIYITSRNQSELDRIALQLKHRFNIDCRIRTPVYIGKREKVPQNFLVINQRNYSKLSQAILLFDDKLSRISNYQPTSVLSDTGMLSRCDIYCIQSYYQEEVFPQPVYDLEVDSPEHTYVLANGLIVGNSTQEAGFFGKQLAQSVHRQVVTEKDCGSTNGIPTTANDSDNLGTVLAVDSSSYPAGTIITPQVQAKLGETPIYVRSPITCQAHDGVCSLCSGVRSKGKLPEIGDNIGLPAAQALSEKMSQGMLSAKHSGGQVGAGGPSRSGFDYVNQLIQVPTNFAGAATLSKIDGLVKKIEPAPQGGNYVYVNDQQYYVPHSQAVTAKLNDEIEAGDSLSNGVPNPAEVVEHKGIGAGRLYFMNALAEGFKNSNIKSNRRNLEALSRGLVNHVQITDPEGYGGFLVDDVVPYDEFRRQYQPREDAMETKLDNARNHYLEKDTLQYTIGTRLTPRVIADLKKNKVNTVLTHPAPPPFKPNMVRAMENVTHDRDWMTRMYGSYLGKGFQDSVRRGRTSETESTSFVPGLAEGTNFGKSLFDTGKY